MTPLSHNDALKRIKGLKAALNDLEAALNGEPFKWGDVDGRYKQEALRKIDFHLLTRDGIERSGLVLKEGEDPVGTCFSGGGYKQPMNLYLVETQTIKAKRRREYT